MADVQQIKKGIEMAKNIVNNKKKNINIYRKKQYIKTLDWQILYIYSTLHGTKTWTMNKQLQSWIEAMEMLIYRRKFILWNKNKEDFKRLWMKREMATEVKNRQLKNFGHMKKG